MKHVLILERNSQSLVESHGPSETNSTRLLMSGSFTEFDVQNRNKRFYTAENFIPCMNALLEKKKMLDVIYGELDHPDVFDIAGKNVSHTIEDLTHNESMNRVDGTIKLLTTPNGMTARAIINDQCPLFVSSRAAGVTEGQGNVILKELFTYDLVVDPGFATSRVSNVNEKYGFSSNIDVPYRIYEMKDESDVNNLFLDNKNDKKTEMDIKEMQSFVANEIAKVERTILAKIQEGTTPPEELNTLLEKQQVWQEEMTEIKKYLELFKTKINSLVKENSNLKAANEKLNSELNENTIYANHLASGLNNVKENITSIDKKIDDNIAFTESVAKETEVAQLFIEEVAQETNITQKMVEHVAKETEVAQKMLEHVAKETEIAQLFIEEVAQETDIAQKMLEHVANDGKDTRDFAELVANETNITRQFAEFVANESKVNRTISEKLSTDAKDNDLWVNYVAEKVDGIIQYIPTVVEGIQNTVPLQEGIRNSIHGIESIDKYLGITEEQNNWNNFTNNVSDEEEEELEADPIQDVPTEGGELEIVGIENQEPIEDTLPEIGAIDHAVEIPATNTDGPMASDIPADADMSSAVETDLGDDGSLESTILSKLVKILGSDETGIVMEITPDDKLIIQKSGSELPESEPFGRDQIEVIDTENNIAETVSNVLEEVKKQAILANKQPHFFSFLSEENIANFKQFDKSHQTDIILAMENATYTSEQEVLNIIGNTLNKSTASYEENLVTNIPEEIKEAWNSLSHGEKVSLLTESKYFTLRSKSDIKSFWNTRPFAKAVISTEATLIKESFNSEDVKLSDDYVDAFIKSFKNLK